MVVPSSRRQGLLALLSLAAMVGAVQQGAAQSAVQAVGKPKAAAMPSFVDKSRVSDLVAARAAIGKDAASPQEVAEQERQAEARLMSETDVVARRAEEERALAAEIRAKAEALSQRFAEELSQDRKPGKPAAVAVAASQGQAPVGSAVQDERTAQTMKRAADALARARSTLEEADRRVAESAGSPVGTWDKVKAEFADARRKAAEAVASAQQALVAAPSAVAAITTGSLPDPDAKGKVSTTDPHKTLPPPYALGGTLR